MFLFLTDGYIQVNVIQRCWWWREREIKGFFFNAAFIIINIIIIIIICDGGVLTSCFYHLGWGEKDYSEK